MPPHRKSRSHGDDGESQKGFLQRTEEGVQDRGQSASQNEDEAENGKHDRDQHHPSENAMEQQLVEAIARRVVASFGPPYRCGGDAGTGAVPFRGHDAGA